MSDTSAPDHAASEADSASRDEAETDRFAAQLQQDARSWTARDNDASDRAADALALSVKQVKAAATIARKRAKPAPKPVVAESTKDRPFSMSYEGVTNAQYIAGRIARGAR